MALPPVVVRFLAQGVPDVQRAMRSISDTVTRGDRGAETSARRASSARVNVAEREAREKIAAWRRADQFHSAALRAGQREAERLSRAEVRAAEAAAVAKMRIATRLAAEEQRAHAASLRERLTAGGAYGPSRPGSAAARLSLLETAKNKSPAEQKAILSQVRELAALDRARAAGTKEAERSAGAEGRIVNQAAREKVQAMLRADREVERAKAHGLRTAERIAREDVRLTERAEREKVRLSERADRERLRNRRELGQRFSQTLSGAASGVASKLMTGARMAAAPLLAMGGGFDISESVNRAAQNSGQLEDVLNSAVNRKSAIKSNWERREASSVAPEINSTAIRYGMQRSEVQQGLGSFTGITGDFETAQKMMPQLAELSRATGSKFDDLAQAAGNIGNAFDDMTDSGKKAEKIMTIMRTLAGQGKAGNVELKDQAVQAAKIVASGSKFEGDNADNIIKFGAIMQAARGGGGAWNAASSATAVNSFTAVFGKNARRDAFKAENIDIAGADGKVRSPELIIADSIDKTKGDIGKMNHLFGSVMADRATAKYVDVWRKAEAKKKGTGKKAVLDEIKGMTEGVTMTQDEVTSAAKRRVGAVDAQMESGRALFDKAVEERLIPSLLQLIPVIEKLVPTFVDLHAQALPAFVDLIKTVAEFADKNRGLIHDIAAHPIGAIMAAEVTKSIVTANIGALITKLLGGGGSGGVGLPGAGGLAKGAAVIGAGVLAGAATKEWVDESFAAENKEVDGRRQRLLAATNLLTSLNRGDATPEQRAKASEVAKMIDADAQATAREMDPENQSLVQRVTGGFGSVVSPEATAEAQATQLREQARMHAEEMAMQQKLITALSKVVSAPPAAPGAPAGGGAANRGNGGPLVSPGRSGGS